jgi:hypothetical protein
MAGSRADVDTRVSRTGYSGSFRYDGARFEDEVEVGKPRSHPALWSVDDLRGNNEVKTEKPVQVGDYRATGALGYTGFIPGKISENVIQKTRAHAQLESRKIREYAPIAAGQSKGYETLYDKPSGRRTLKTMINTTDMKHSNAYSGKIDGVSSEMSLIIDHDVPPKKPHSAAKLGEEILGYAGHLPERIKEAAKPQGPPASIGRAIAGYSGFIPGKVAESVFGATAEKTIAKAMKTRPYF